MGDAFQSHVRGGGGATFAILTDLRPIEEERCIETNKHTSMTNV